MFYCLLVLYFYVCISIPSLFSSHFWWFGDFGFLQVQRNEDKSTTLKLADFGLAKHVVRPIFTVCGTPTYVAPEILSEKGKGYTWLCGTLACLLTNVYFLIFKFHIFQHEAVKNLRDWLCICTWILNILSRSPWPKHENFFLLLLLQRRERERERVCVCVCVCVLVGQWDERRWRIEWETQASKVI